MNEDMSHLTEEEIQEIVEVAEGKIKEAEHPDGKEIVEWIYTNDKAGKNVMRQLFHLFYSGVFANRVGIMQCLDTETDKIETILVGISHTAEDSVVTWPIAKVLTEGEQGRYLAPDGNGGYLGLKETETDE